MSNLLKLSGIILAIFLVCAFGTFWPLIVVIAVTKFVFGFHITVKLFLILWAIPGVLASIVALFFGFMVSK